MSDGPPGWGPAGDRAGARSDWDRLAAYEDSAVRRVLSRLGLAGEARRIAAAVRDVSGEPRCTFAAFDEALQFPVRFGVARIRGVKVLALVDLFDRWTTLPLHKQFAALADEHDPGTPACLLFRYTGDAASPGPKGGRFMALHSYESTPAVDRTRVSRTLAIGRRRTTLVLETLDDLLAQFKDWQPA